MSDLASALRERVIVLDGGLATELERRGHDLSGALWSARLLADAPDEIEAVHRAYFAAGAAVATTASYQASFEGLGDDATVLMHRSVERARAATDGVEGRFVAASVGPYGAVLADGSEYRGDYGVSVADLVAFHRPRMRVLADAGPDLLAIETIPCLAEVEAVLAALDGIGIPAWVSVTCSGLHTRAGEPAADAFATAASSPDVVAVGVNCTAPADVAALVGVAATTGLPVLAYPNSGESWDAVRRTWGGDPAFAARDVRAWRDAGARGIGGCCRVGPAEITAVAAALR